ncbi:MAG: peroxiredoxin-like family protein [Prochloraceae cyanobacterium]|nr:peroxiredoxin-like family protein [Prochloraceae cyanobacterium]
MNLTEELNKYRNQFHANKPEQIKAVMVKATEELAKSDIVDNSLGEGETVPNFILPNAVGQKIELRSLLLEGSVVISFYRGGWCPYCNLELRALQQALPEMKKLGANLIAISPQTPDSSLSTAEKNKLCFQVLSDIGNKVAKEFGLVFTLPEKLRPLYLGFGIDVVAHNGDKSFELPLAATYIVDRNGLVIRAFVDADYTKRLDPEEIIAVLRELRN